MKAPLLYFSLFSLVWAQSELQPHYKKSKQKCTGEHQITVKSRNAKHGYYVFHYVYSSLTPVNQTWIKNEDGDKKISTGRHGHKEKGSRKPIDNYTADEKEEGHKRVTEMGNDKEDRGPSESTENLNNQNENSSSRDLRQHHGNSSNIDIPQDNLASITNKGRNDFATDNTADDIDGSGDLDFLDQTERHHSIISGNEHHNLEIDRQDTSSTEADSLWKRNEVGLSGISNDTKIAKDTYIKSEVKKNNAGEIQEINLYSYILNQTKDSNRKDNLDVFKKIQNAPKEEPGKYKVGYVDSRGKSKEENASAGLQNHFNIQGKISGDLPGKMERIGNGGNHTRFSGIDDVETVNENVISHIGVHGGSDDEYAMINRKSGGQNIYEEAQSPQKNEVNDYIPGSKHKEVADVLKTHKKSGVKEDIIAGRSSSHMDVAALSKTHGEGEGEEITVRSISEVENPIFTQTGKTNQTTIVLSARLNSSGFTKSYTKSGGEDTLLGGTSVSQGLASGAKSQSQKGTSEVDIINRKPINGVEGSDFTTANQKKADRHEKINRNTHRDKEANTETREKSKLMLGVTFQEGNKEVVKGNINYRKPPGTADLSTDSSSGKAKKSRNNPIGSKSALILAQGSRNYKHIAESQQHPPYPLKDDRKITKPSKKRSRDRNGRHGSSTAKRYHKHLGDLQRKSSRHDRKGSSGKNVHASDSSQSSESEESRRRDSRQSYEDYQNDNPGSYPSAESTEENLSAGSNQSNDQNQTGEICSQEDSQEHKHS